MTDCIFCKIITGEIPSYKIAEDEVSCAFMDAFPVSRGHVLVVPKAHIERFDMLEPDMAASLIRRVHELAPRIAEAVGAQGFNLGLNNGTAAGQVVPHVHWHIIPRYEGDHLQLWPNQKVATEELQRVAEGIRLTIAG